MANNNPQRILSDGTTSRMCVYRVFGITTGDTIQMNSDFFNVTYAVFIPSTGAVVPAAPAISANTLLTLGQVGLAKDDGFLVVYGSGVQQ
jgi:hypothetical protein